ncbi:hypothetical protein MMC25_004451 [Agyrium rufum]|nr:hypothetical protein [Agyrium rufum]
MAILEDTALQRFDQLRQQGKLIYEPSTPEHVVHQGFDLEFRIVPAFEKKPVPAAEDVDEDAARKKPFNPFLNPEPDFVLKDIGPSHVLELNKFCVYRPSLILHTKEELPQTDDLDLGDIEALWTTLTQLEGDYLALYNCGVDAGASQSHKHMQLFPLSDLAHFTLYPERLELSAELPLSYQNAPYKHWILKLSSTSSAKEVYDRYIKLLKLSKEALEGSDSTAYNVIAVKTWILLIPRSERGKDDVPVNGAGMLGLIWLEDRQERERWNECGLTKHLAYVGISK